MYGPRSNSASSRGGGGYPAGGTAGATASRRNGATATATLNAMRQSLNSNHSSAIPTSSILNSSNGSTNNHGVVSFSAMRNSSTIRSNSGTSRSMGYPLRSNSSSNKVKVAPPHVVYVPFVQEIADPVDAERAARYGRPSPIVVGRNASLASGRGGVFGKAVPPPPSQQQLQQLRDTTPVRGAPLPAAVPSTGASAATNIRSGTSSGAAAPRDNLGRSPPRIIHSRSAALEQGTRAPTAAPAAAAAAVKASSGSGMGAAVEEEGDFEEYEYYEEFEEGEVIDEEGAEWDGGVVSASTVAPGASVTSNARSALDNSTTSRINPHPSGTASPVSPVVDVSPPTSSPTSTVASASWRGGGGAAGLSRKASDASTIMASVGHQHQQPRYVSPHHIVGAPYPANSRRPSPVVGSTRPLPSPRCSPPISNSSPYGSDCAEGMITLAPPQHRVNMNMKGAFPPLPLGAHHFDPATGGLLSNNGSRRQSPCSSALPTPRGRGSRRDSAPDAGTGTEAHEGYGSSYTPMGRERSVTISTFGEATRFRRKAIRNMMHFHNNVERLQKEAHGHLRHQIIGAIQLDPSLTSRLRAAARDDKQLNGVGDGGGAPNDAGLADSLDDVASLLAGGPHVSAAHSAKEVVPQVLRDKLAKDEERYIMLKDALSKLLQASHLFMQGFLSPTEADAVGYMSPAERAASAGRERGGGNSPYRRHSGVAVTDSLGPNGLVGTRDASTQAEIIPSPLRPMDASSEPHGASPAGAPFPPRSSPSPCGAPNSAQQRLYADDDDDYKGGYYDAMAQPSPPAMDGPLVGEVHPSSAAEDLTGDSSPLLSREGGGSAGTRAPSAIDDQHHRHALGSAPFAYPQQSPPQPDAVGGDAPMAFGAGDDRSPSLSTASVGSAGKRQSPAKAEADEGPAAVSPPPAFVLRSYPATPERMGPSPSKGKRRGGEGHATGEGSPSLAGDGSVNCSLSAAEEIEFEETVAANNNTINANGASPSPGRNNNHQFGVDYNGSYASSNALNDLCDDDGEVSRTTIDGDRSHNTSLAMDRSAAVKGGPKARVPRANGRGSAPRRDVSPSAGPRRALSPTTTVAKELLVVGEKKRKSPSPSRGKRAASAKRSTAAAPGASPGGDRSTKKGGVTSPLGASSGPRGPSSSAYESLRSSHTTRASGDDSITTPLLGVRPNTPLGRQMSSITSTPNGGSSRISPSSPIKLGPMPHDEANRVILAAREASGRAHKTLAKQRLDADAEEAARIEEKLAARAKAQAVADKQRADREAYEARTADKRMEQQLAQERLIAEAMEAVALRAEQDRIREEERREERALAREERARRAKQQQQQRGSTASSNSIELRIITDSRSGHSPQSMSSSSAVMSPLYADDSVGVAKGRGVVMSPKTPNILSDTCSGTDVLPNRASNNNSVNPPSTARPDLGRAASALVEPQRTEGSTMSYDFYPTPLPDATDGAHSATNSEADRLEAAAREARAKEEERAEAEREAARRVAEAAVAREKAEAAEEAAAEEEKERARRAQQAEDDARLLREEEAAAAAAVAKARRETEEKERQQTARRIAEEKAAWEQRRVAEEAEGRRRAAEEEEMQRKARARLQQEHERRQQQEREEQQRRSPSDALSIHYDSITSTANNSASNSAVPNNRSVGQRDRSADSIASSSTSTGTGTSRVHERVERERLRREREEEHRRALVERQESVAAAAERAAREREALANAAAQREASERRAKEANAQRWAAESMASSNGSAVRRNHLLSPDSDDDGGLSRMAAKPRLQPSVSSRPQAAPISEPLIATTLSVEREGSVPKTPTSPADGGYSGRTTTTSSAALGAAVATTTPAAPMAAEGAGTAAAGGGRRRIDLSKYVIKDSDPDSSS